MKKILLLVPVLFATGMASAQSYIKQPDASTYEVREYKPAKETPAPAQPQAQPQEGDTQNATVEAQKTESVNTTAPAQAPQAATVAEKEIQNRKRK